MKITATAQGYAFSVQSGEWQTVGEAPCRYLSTSLPGGRWLIKSGRASAVVQAFGE
jgi:hypothetical protein